MSAGALAQDALAAADGGWPAAAVRDTVAAIVEGQEYQRTLTASVFEQLAALLGRGLRRVLELLPSIGIGERVLVLAAVALAVLVIARIVLRARAQREHWAGGGREGRGVRRTDPWAEAERLAAEGAYLEAAHQLCAALLVASARRGEVTLHPSKTTGDYAREMRRRRAPSEADFQRFRARYDRVVYDAQRCDAGDWRALLDDARPLLARERAA